MIKLNLNVTGVLLRKTYIKKGENMKKTIFSVLLSFTLFTTLNAEIYTGTSLVGGVSGIGTQVRLDQYIGSTDYEMFYGKIGIAQEMSDGDNSPEDITITSIVAGVGVNVLNVNNFFIDLSGEYYYQIAGGVSKGDKLVYTSFTQPRAIANDIDFSSLAASVGLGYSFGSWSLRADLIMILNSPDFTYVDGEVEGQEDRNLIGVGVTYWY